MSIFDHYGKWFLNFFYLDFYNNYNYGLVRYPDKKDMKNIYMCADVKNRILFDKNPNVKVFDLIVERIYK